VAAVGGEGAAGWIWYRGFGVGSLGLEGGGGVDGEWCNGSTLLYALTHSGATQSLFLAQVQTSRVREEGVGRHTITTYLHPEARGRDISLIQILHCAPTVFPPTTAHGIGPYPRLGKFFS